MTNPTHNSYVFTEQTVFIWSDQVNAELITTPKHLVFFQIVQLLHYQ